MTRAAVPGAELRARAARVLLAVLREGRSLKAELADALPGIADPRDRALLEAICFEAVRFRRRYEATLAAWLQRPLPARSAPVHHLLIAGLAQLDALRLSAHAAVATTAEAARVLGAPGQVGLVNALLRRATREPLPTGATPAERTSHPDWLVAALARDWPEDVEAILVANNQPAPLWLRVVAPAARHEVAARLAAAGWAPAAPESPSQALRIDARAAPESLPGWAGGTLVVQDGAAQLAVAALAPRAGGRALDACAAPGGKTAQLVEAVGECGSVLALDVDARRLARVEATLRRLHAPPGVATCRVADAAAPGAWWDGQPFDAILLDAPCSATGIIRRQPDIKWHRRADDIPVLAALQARLLDALWPLLAPGGRLLYATCSVLKDENERQVDAFLARHADAEALALDARFGRAAGVGRQRLPGEDGMDGFFYALLARRR